MDVAEVRELIERGGVADRAFADGVIRMKRGPLVELHPLLSATAARVHAELRTRIAAGLRGDELRAIFEATPVDGEGRDHVVEEILGIAYPPLDESIPGPEQIPYVPAGYEEIMHAFSTTRLCAGDAFLDVGSGLGKVVMLAELLVGAKAAGVEVDRRLTENARAAAGALGLHASFICGDARTAPLPPANVVFMYLPFTGTVLEAVMTRIDALDPRWVCAGTLDQVRYPRLERVGEPKSWLQVYAVGNSSVVASPST